MMESTSTSPKTGVLQLDTMQYASSVVDSDDLQIFSEFNGFNEDAKESTTYTIPLDNGGIEHYEVPVSSNTEYVHNRSRTQSNAEPGGKYVSKHVFLV